jgi:hypothetical protein
MRMQAILGSVNNSIIPKRSVPFLIPAFDNLCTLFQAFKIWSVRMARSKPESSLGPLFADALRLLRRDFYSRTQGLGLTPALARLLLYVAREPNSRQIDLAIRLEVTPVTLGRMVDRLVERGYVKRVQDMDDRRAYRVRIAAASEALVSRLEQIATATRERALKGFSASDRKSLLTLLARLAGNLESDH